MASPATRRDASDKREAILEAALGLFAERGFHGTPVPLVAEVAGVGAGTLYRYFDSKEALVNALYQRCKAAMGEAILTAFPVDAPPRKQFHELWSRLSAFARENATALAFLELHHHGPYLDEKSRAMDEVMLGPARAFVERAQAQGEVKPYLPDLLIAVVFGSFVGVVKGCRERAIELSPEVLEAAEQCAWDAIRRLQSSQVSPPATCEGGFFSDRNRNEHSFELPRLERETTDMSTSKTILITGATAGIGRHAALHLASLGHHVIATGRKESALAELREQATQSGSRGRLSVLRLDVTDPASIAAVAREVSELTGGRGLDVLVNNAGYGLVAPLEEVTDAELRAQFDTNVFGLMAVTRAFLPQLRARGAGRIVNVSSIGGRLTMPFFGAYNATKYAVESLSDALRMELLPFGIDVSLVEPGPIRSDFAARAMESVSAHASPDSPYAPVYARADEINAQTESMAVGPEHTSRAIAHAALARRPRARYVVPGRLALMIGLVGMLPTRLVDWVLRQSMGLTPKKLLGAPGQAAASRALSGKRLSVDSERSPRPSSLPKSTLSRARRAGGRGGPS